VAIRKVLSDKPPFAGVFCCDEIVNQEYFFTVSSNTWFYFSVVKFCSDYYRKFCSVTI